MSLQSNTTAGSTPGVGGVPQLPFSMAQDFGSPLIGTWIISALWGILSAQVYSYLMEYPKDEIVLKAYVIVVWALSAVHGIFCCYAAYHYIITNAFNLMAFVYNFWGLNAAVASHMTLTTLVFIYFIRLAYQLSRPEWRWPVVLGLSIPVAGHVATGFVTVAYMCQATILTDYAKFSKTWMLFMAVTQLIADVIMTTVLCILLNHHKTGFKRTNLMVNTLIIFTVGRGFLTAAVAFAELLSISLNPNSLWWGALEYSVAELYANSLLVTLNSRNTVRDAVDSKNASSFTVPLSRIMRGTSGQQSEEAPESQRARSKSSVKIASGNYSSTDAIELDITAKHNLDAGC